MSAPIDTRDALGFTDVLFNIGLIVLLVLVAAQAPALSGWDALGGREGPREPDLTLHVTSAPRRGLLLAARPRASSAALACRLDELEALALAPDVHCIRLVVAPDVPYGELHRLERTLRSAAARSPLPKQIQRVVLTGESR